MFRYKSGYQLSPLLPNTGMEVLAKKTKQEKKRQKNQRERDKMLIIYTLFSFKIQETL